jgi:hypothetical protein
LETAGYYQREAELVGAAYDDEGTYLGSFEDLGAVIGGSGYEDTDASLWTSQMRLRERQILEQCLDLEHAAAEAMRRALPLMTVQSAE